MLQRLRATSWNASVIKVGSSALRVLLSKCCLPHQNVTCLSKQIENHKIYPLLHIFIRISQCQMLTSFTAYRYFSNNQPASQMCLCKEKEQHTAAAKRFNPDGWFARPTLCCVSNQCNLLREPMNTRVNCTIKNRTACQLNTFTFHSIARRLQKTSLCIPLVNVK